MNSEQLPEGIPEEELIRIYVSAARTNLAAMREAWEQLSSSDSFPNLATIHRLSHNLKGSSCQFGFPEPARLAAGMEGFVAHVLQDGGGTTQGDRELLLEALAAFAEMVDQIERNQPNTEAATLCQRLRGRSG